MLASALCSRYLVYCKPEVAGQLACLLPGCSVTTSLRLAVACLQPAAIVYSTCTSTFGFNSGCIFQANKAAAAKASDAAAQDIAAAGGKAEASPAAPSAAASAAAASAPATSGRGEAFLKVREDGK